MSDPWVLTTPAPPGVREAYGPAPSQHAWIRRPPGSERLRTLVMIHGGFWRAAYDAEHVGHLCADLARRGWATVALEYRRIGEQGGAWPGTLTDVSAGLDALQGLVGKYGLDLGRAVWMGHSAGGHLALWAVSRSSGPGALQRPSWRPRRVVGLAPVSDLVEADRLELSRHVTLELLGGSAREQPARYAEASPAAHLPLRVPMVVVHGTKDNVVPLAMNRSFVERARKAGDDIRLVMPEDADHFDVIDPKSKAWAQVLDAIGAP
jgi:acetyl esterase/lipase